ncbi:hypothetical protein LCGC14_0577450 [marine sediment metagenome]|uniref:DJ-1/PfpI domain-containing protein n=1 Tax=marine sediment metagenome TaxID=412755 RepID=A0A0F9S0Y4_9ZZZZ
MTNRRKRQSSQRQLSPRRKALVVTASLYNETELFTILRKLAAADIDWDIVARRRVIRAEKGNTDEFEVDYLLREFDPKTLDQYCAVIFTSGETSETRHMWFSQEIKEIAERASEQEIPIGAVCCAAPCVRYIAKDRRVTGFPLHEILTLFKSAGAHITGRSVEVDGTLVTAEAEIQVLDWMNAIIDLTNGRQPTLSSDDAHKWFPFWRGVPDSGKDLLRRPFHAGFTGTTADEMLPVIDSECRGDRILLPFTGSGKEISILAREGRTITSFDTLFFSKMIVQGIFAGEELASNEINQSIKGWAYLNRPIHVDEESAQFIDTVAQTGEPYRLAALGISIIRCTMRGRLDGWIGSVEQLEDSYDAALARNREWFQLPGRLVHYHNNVLGKEGRSITDHPWDTMIVDPPKVIGRTDIYSERYAMLDSCLSQEDVELPIWKSEGYIDRIRELLQIPWKRCLFMYTTGVSPTVEEIERLLHSVGEIVGRYQVLRTSRKDILYVVEK